MTLLIALAPPRPADAAGPLRLHHATSRDGRTADRHGVLALDELAAASRTAGDVVAVIPAAALSWHAVTLPPLPRRLPAARLRAVLDGLLEEHLLDEPAAVHLALEPGHETSPGARPAWVACCDRAWLARELQQLEAAGLHPVRLLPETAPSAAAPRVRVTGEPDRLWLEVCDAHGVWRAPLADAAGLHDALARTGVPPDAVAAHPAAAAPLERWLGRPVPLRTPADDWLQALEGDWDLAQFEFQRTARHPWLQSARRRLVSLWRAPRWRAARWGLLALAGAQLVGMNAWAWHEARDLRTRESQLRALVSQALPGQPLLDAPRQLQRALDTARRAAGQASPNDPAPLIDALAQALPAGLALARIDYEAGVLQATAPGLAADALASARTTLAARGLTLQAGPDDSLRLHRSPP